MGAAISGPRALGLGRPYKQQLAIICKSGIDGCLHTRVHARALVVIGGALRHVQLKENVQACPKVRKRGEGGESARDLALMLHGYAALAARGVHIPC